ncbi:MAG: hypothetical protein R3E79_09500 [Caldilineaceae bacterium]
MQRREFIKLMGASAASGMALYDWADSRAAQDVPGQRVYQAADLSGWEVVLGDGLYTAPGQPSITPDDISTTHWGSYSELRANRWQRGIMAHNITFKRFIDERALTYTHLCDCAFRLPVVPATNNWTTNAQTLEVSLALWDGGATRLDYTLALQWILNPWLSTFGAIRCWTNQSGGAWQSVGYLAPDTNWHTVSLVFNYQAQTTALLIDGQSYLSTFAGTPKAATWGTETAARLGTEIISLYPGSTSTAPFHVAEFKDWRWVWIPNG